MFECVQGAGVVESAVGCLSKHANISQLDRVAQGLTNVAPMAAICYQTQTELQSVTDVMLWSVLLSQHGCFYSPDMYTLSAEACVLALS